MLQNKMLMIAASLVVSGANAASAATPVEVVEHHVAMMKKGDLKGIMSDYAANTVVITPNGLVHGQIPATGAGVFSGISKARQVFETLTDKNHHPGVVTMQTRIEPDGGDVALLHWVQFKGTAQQVTGEDVFVVRGGKILYQAILVDPAK
jgi:ketosteroid isomerase-like protein